MLLVPLHGAVVANHHLPQCLAQISQAGNVAVQSDMLPTREEKLTFTDESQMALTERTVDLQHAEDRKSNTSATT